MGTVHLDPAINSGIRFGLGNMTVNVAPTCLRRLDGCRVVEHFLNDRGNAFGTHGVCVAALTRRVQCTIAINKFIHEIMISL